MSDSSVPADWEPGFVDEADMEAGELSIEASNNARLQALNAIGVGINGINESLILFMLERLLGPTRTQQVKTEHQAWLADELDKAEDQVQKMQRQHWLTRK